MLSAQAYRTKDCYPITSIVSATPLITVDAGQSSTFSGGAGGLVINLNSFKGGKPGKPSEAVGHF